MALWPSRLHIVLDVVIKQGYVIVSCSYDVFGRFADSYKWFDVLHWSKMLFHFYFCKN